MLAFQDLYADKFSHCYGCGKHNPAGHQLKSAWNGEDTAARFTPGPQYTGGVVGHVYGGMIAALLDCHGTASAAAFAHRHDGGRFEAGTQLPRFVTASLKVDFLRPTPLGVELVLVGRLRSIEGRKVWVDLTLSADGQPCAKGEMLAIRPKEE